jgi:hypothetical protein
MPKFFEIFGLRASDLNEVGLLEIKTSICPFTGCLCDGGGNRHQTKITFSPEHGLRSIFHDTLTSIVPAVCSIDYGKNQWVVCPRRLMGFKNEYFAIPPTNHFLQDHEKDALTQAGLKSGIEYGIWSEVYLQYAIDDTEIDYHFDFIIAPIRRDIPISLLGEEYQTSPLELLDLAKCAKTGKILEGNAKTGILKAVPDLAEPLIIEVMTASTSGSNTAAGTNISAAFMNLILGRDYQGPGINKRQVWGRMATQLFAKSALAEFWGGKTYWLVQDQLLHNIELTTKLKITEGKDLTSGTINFISMKYCDQEKLQRPLIKLDKVARVKSGISFQGDGSCSDILLPKAFPPKLWLLKGMLRRNLAAVISI